VVGDDGGHPDRADRARPAPHPLSRAHAPRRAPEVRGPRSFNAPTAKTYRPAPNLLVTGDLEERVECITALLFDTTKSDLRRSLLSGEVALDQGQDPRDIGLGRSIALLTPSQAAEFIAEVKALIARFDDAHAHEPPKDTRPFAFTWALYPSSRRIR
jgi:hypothetical protein